MRLIDLGLYRTALLSILACAIPLVATASLLIQSEWGMPGGVAYDETRKLLISSDILERVVRTSTVDANGIVGTWTDYGATATLSDPAALHGPQGVAVDSAGNIFAVDTVAGEVQLYRRSGSGYVHDPSFAPLAGNAVAGTKVSFPRDVAVGPGDNVYLLDSANDRILVAAGANATTWTVKHSNPQWGNPYGIGVGTDGSLLVADTDNHRIVVIDNAGQETALGGYGTERHQFRFPRDVAQLSDGRLIVADTQNHRVVAIPAGGTGTPQILASSPAMQLPQRVAVGKDGRIYVADTGLSDVVVLQTGDGESRPRLKVDAFIADHLHDDGTEPSSDFYFLSSPSILVRNEDDVDLNAPLLSYSHQAARYGRANHVYFMVENRSGAPIAGLVAKLYWKDPTAGHEFPGSWSIAGFVDETGLETNTISVPIVPARDPFGMRGYRIVGPIRWHPPAPHTSGAGDGSFEIAVRLLHGGDPVRADPDSDPIRASNNLAIKPVRVVDGPIAVGRQNLLVVSLKDVFGRAPASERVAESIGELAAWVGESSHGAATVKAIYRGPVRVVAPLAPEASASHPLIELTEEVLSKLLESDAELLDRGTIDPMDDIARIIFVSSSTENAHSSTTGTFPYRYGGREWPLSVSLHHVDDAIGGYVHGFLHQLSLGDLYIYDNVQFYKKYVVDGWDPMAKPFEAQQPIAWAKHGLGWKPVNQSAVRFVPRPAPGTSVFRTFPIGTKFDDSNKNRQAIAVGLTPGVTALEDESHYYWIEARRPEDLDKVPSEGVLVYYANQLVKQGHGRVVVQDAVPATDEIEDAVLKVGEEIDLGAGLVIKNFQEVTGGYEVGVVYKTPPDTYNVKVRQGEHHWESPDIWIDNQRDGGGYASRPSPENEQPIGGEENRIYARIWNDGEAPAKDVVVQFLLSAPWQTVGGKDDFDTYYKVLIPTIPAGSYVDTFVTWAPDASGDPHNCVKVELQQLTDDTNDADNWAQQNFRVIESNHSSPYDPVSFSYQVSNDQEDERVVFVRAEGVPAGWDVEISDEVVRLGKGDTKVGEFLTKPPDDTPDCQDVEILVTGWEASGDTLARLGGTTLNVALRERTRIEKLEVAGRSCKDGTEAPPTVLNQCHLLVSRGCTSPPRPYETATIRYGDPAGIPIYQSVELDGAGCFYDEFAATNGGQWLVEARYDGSECAGSATSESGYFVPLERIIDSDGDGLPDDREVQGDADADGIRNHHDPDSDDDGIRDGDEAADKDGDMDGLVAVVDPDE